MIKVSKFVSIVIVLAVCLGLLLVPGVPLSNKVALAAGNVTIEVLPSTTVVVPGGTFNVTVQVQNPDAMDIYGCQAKLDFDSSYFNVTGITGGTIFTYVLKNEFSNPNGTIDYDAAMPTPPGTPTNATSILVCNISCQALAKEGASTMDFVYQTFPPRKTMVTLGASDYLEYGNMSLMHSGTVRIGTPTLTVNVTLALKGDVNISGVTPSSYPNTTTWDWDEVVELNATTTVENWTFTHWSGDLNGSENPTNITMDDSKNITANFVPLRTLTMAVNGNGTTVPAIGNHTYGEGTVVNITAEADSGWHFVNWTTANMSEIGNYTAQSTTVTVDENETVTANFAEVTAATLEGHVNLQGLPATNVTVRFFAPNTTTEYVAMKTYTSTDSSGNFTIDGIAPGTYDVGVKGSTSLSNLESGVNLTGGGTTYRDFGILLEGDANGDDYIESVDFGILSGAWLSWPEPPQPNWDARADFNRDDFVESVDFGLLSGNWLKWGDCDSYPGNWT